MALPRLLVIMGSGETAPTMTSVHADLLARLEPPPTSAVFLDTPFGFQENADEICARAVAYFRENVRHPLTVASFRRAGDPVTYETMLAAVRQAGYVFSGPGSPSYALRQWAQTDLPGALREKLRRGGCVVFSSAAACTLGAYALPVYEIYKVGSEVHWLEGLDVLGDIGLVAAVVPHFDNREGGTHDTRYCYMGERRLRQLEALLPDAAVVLGVDEHTACIIDLDAETVTVRGHGGVTLRRHGRQRSWPSGAVIELERLRRGPEGDGAAVSLAGAPAVEGDDGGAAGADGGDPFVDAVAAHTHDFDAAVARGDAEAALRAVLAMEQLLWEWSRETFATDARERARSQLRTLLVRLGHLAHAGMRDPRELVGPYVEAVLDLRRRARAERRWADADALREALVNLGVEVHDGPEATTWSLRRGDGRG